MMQYTINLSLLLKSILLHFRSRRAQTTLSYHYLFTAGTRTWSQQVPVQVVSPFWCRHRQPSNHGSTNCQGVLLCSHRGSTEEIVIINLLSYLVWMESESLEFRTVTWSVLLCMETFMYVATRKLEDPGPCLPAGDNQDCWSTERVTTMQSKARKCSI